MKKNRTMWLARVLIFAALMIPNIAMTSWAFYGVNLSGSEYSWETFPIASHLEYLNSRGVVVFRLPIAWEKLQPVLNGPLNQTEVGNLKTFLNLVASHNMQAIVDIHNYGRYNPNWAADAAANYGIVAVNNSSGLVIGSSSLPIFTFQDFWTKLADVLAGHVGLAGYDIMNEPHDLGTGVWPMAAQAAVNGIRSVDMSTTIYVEGTQWASAYYWSSYNSDLLLDDPANKLIYEAHLYFDGNGSGAYTQTYDQQGAYPNWGVDHVQPFIGWLNQHKLKGYIGEYGVPDNDPRWLTLLDNFLNTLKQNGVSGTYWFYAYPDPTGANSWWPPMSGTVYSISLDPELNGQDKPQWSVLEKF